MSVHTREEIVMLATGQPVEEIRWCRDYRYVQDFPAKREIWACVGIDSKRVIVRDSRPVGTEMSTSMTTLQVTAFRHIYTVEEHRHEGNAQALILSALDEAASHALTKYVALWSPPDTITFFEQIGFVHPEKAPPGFMVYELTDEPWPEGQVRADPW